MRIDWIQAIHFSENVLNTVKTVIFPIYCGLVIFTAVIIVLIEYVRIDSNLKKNIEEHHKTGYVYQSDIPYNLLGVYYDLIRYVKKDINVLDLILFGLLNFCYLPYLALLPLLWYKITKIFIQILWYKIKKKDFEIPKPDLGSASMNISFKNFIKSYLAWIEAFAYLTAYLIFKNKNKNIKEIIKNIGLVYVIGRPLWYFTMVISIISDLRKITKSDVWNRKKIWVWPLIFAKKFFFIVEKHYRLKNISYFMALKPLKLKVVDCKFYINGFNPAHFLAHMTIEDFIVFNKIATHVFMGKWHFGVIDKDSLFAQILTSSQLVKGTVQGASVRGSILYSSEGYTQYSVLSAVEREHIYEDFILAKVWHKLNLDTTEKFMGFIFKSNFQFWGYYGRNFLIQRNLTEAELSNKNKIIDRLKEEAEVKKEKFFELITHSEEEKKVWEEIRYLKDKDKIKTSSWKKLVEKAEKLMTIDQSKIIDKSKFDLDDIPENKSKEASPEEYKEGFVDTRPEKTDIEKGKTYLVEPLLPLEDKEQIVAKKGWFWSSKASSEPVASKSTIIKSKKDILNEKVSLRESFFENKRIGQQMSLMNKVSVFIRRAPINPPVKTSGWQEELYKLREQELEKDIEIQKFVKQLKDVVNLPDNLNNEARNCLEGIKVINKKYESITTISKSLRNDSSIKNVKMPKLDENELEFLEKTWEKNSLESNTLSEIGIEKIRESDMLLDITEMMNEIENMSFDEIHALVKSTISREEYIILGEKMRLEYKKAVLLYYDDKFE